MTLFPREPLDTSDKSSSSNVIWSLIADTFQEARARWLFWGLFALSSLLVLIFLIRPASGPCSGGYFVSGRAIHLAPYL